MRAAPGIHLSHTTTLSPKEVIDYFTDPQKIGEWFADGDAGCSSIPEKNAVAIRVLQDHYLEWVFPSVLPFTHFWVSPGSNKIPFTFHQIDFTADRPILSIVHVTIEENSGNTKLEVSITGDFDEDMKREILYDWKSLSTLYPFNAAA
jgi:hypothetical protein